MAAIDQAVADGVDVINFSISGSTTSFLDAVEVAFLNAADAGVFVAASAGNAGPGAGTVAHPSPWVTTVAASTHDRTVQGSVTLGNGDELHRRLADRRHRRLAPAARSTRARRRCRASDPAEVALCFAGTLDPAVVTGKIVLCDRGVNARVDKSLAVLQAGGVGMVLANTSANTLNADLHSVPTRPRRRRRPAPRSRPTSTAPAAPRPRTHRRGAVCTSAAGAVRSPRSRRAARLAAAGDLLKPDVTAPGVDVLAGGRSARATAAALFNLLSAARRCRRPHVAGLAALLVQQHPDWSPMMIKSALMTTATTIVGTGDRRRRSTTAAGHVAPNPALDPGLVYDAASTTSSAFLCGTGQSSIRRCASRRPSTRATST